MVWSHPQNGLQNLRPLDRVGAVPALVMFISLHYIYIYTDTTLYLITG